MQEQLDMMWSFAQMGGWRKEQANINILKDSCEFIRKAMTQKTAGQRKNIANHVDWNDLETHINIIVIETMILYLSGILDEIENIVDTE